MIERRLDLITLGRSSVDLYGEQVGGPLEDVQSFAKYVGGCPTNIAVGTARLGLRSAVITRVGDEQMGRFIRETLHDEGVDVSHVSTDPDRLTALVILGIASRDAFPHIFYRTDCADMALAPEHIDAEFVAGAGALLVSGTHLSTPGVEAASLAAVEHARVAGTRVVFDIDYRPVLWGLTGAALGESRFVADPEVTARLQRVLASCDLIVGTEQEIHIAGGHTDTVEALRAIRALTPATLIVKSGPQGCWRFPEAIPDTLAEADHSPGFPVEVFNTLGAGDAFMSGLLRGWLRDDPLARCCELANACGALVVARHGCAPAMPTLTELEDFLGRESKPARPREDALLAHLHRVTTRPRAWPAVHAIAFDHRSQLEEMADGRGVPRAAIADLKRLVMRGARSVAEAHPNVSPGAIVDERYGADVLAELTAAGWWLARPVEKPGSRPLAFEARGGVGLALRTWPRAQIAKCLVFMHPDDSPDVRARQLDALAGLASACTGTDHELLLEVLGPPGAALDARSLPAVLEQIYAAGVAPDWWKLRPAPRDAAWAAVAGVIGRRDPHCRGVVLLGLDAPQEELEEHFSVARGQAICKGFAVGRSIFRKPAELWFEGALDDEGLSRAVARNYERLVTTWTG